MSIPMITFDVGEALLDWIGFTKALTRGQTITRDSMQAFVETLDLPAEARDALLALTPAGAAALRPCHWSVGVAKARPANRVAQESVRPVTRGPCHII